jgi:uncharacterized DUF497 family protein
VKFEFDPQKSESNKTKHGIDFVEARAIWRSKHILLGAKESMVGRDRRAPRDFLRVVSAINSTAFPTGSR